MDSRGGIYEGAAYSNRSMDSELNRFIAPEEPMLRAKEPEADEAAIDEAVR
jgi:hypothetical protein